MERGSVNSDSGGPGNAIAIRGECTEELAEKDRFLFMGLRFRRSFKIAPGLRMNLGLRGASLSLGGRGGRLTVGSSGVSASVGLPGTGLSYVVRSSGAAAKPRQIAAKRGAVEKVNVEVSISIHEDGNISLLQCGAPLPPKFIAQGFLQHADVMRAWHKHYAETLNAATNRFW